MSVLSRPHRTSGLTVPSQRTVPAPVRETAPAAPPKRTNRARAAAVLAAGVVMAGAVGAGVWVALDDGSGSAGITSTTITPESRAATEAKRDAAHAGRGLVSDRAAERQRIEALRDAARAGTR